MDRNGLRAAFRQWYEGWERVEDEIEQLIDARKHVVSVSTLRARGRASGVEVVERVAAVWMIRGGKIVRVVGHPSRAEALEAAGLG